MWISLARHKRKFIEKTSALMLKLEVILIIPKKFHHVLRFIRS
jgi:hypothetical protein